MYEKSSAFRELVRLQNPSYPAGIHVSAKSSAALKSTAVDV
jgi:hypothetical protein